MQRLQPSVHTDRNIIEQGLPNIACVEMEGAAVAQVCYEFGIPFTIIRTISDAADAQSDMDFTKFIISVPSNYSEGIIRDFLKVRMLRSAFFVFEKEIELYLYGLHIKQIFEIIA